MSIATGKEGEKIAEQYLRRKGYKILTRNYRTPMGEIDLICLDGETLTFVEVKTNTSSDFGLPESRVNTSKQRQMVKAALGFLKQKGMMDQDCRFDVIGIHLVKDSQPKIEHFENAFEVNGYAH